MQRKTVYEIFPQGGAENTKCREKNQRAKMVGFCGKSVAKSTCSPLQHSITSRALGHNSEAFQCIKQIFALK